MSLGQPTVNKTRLWLALVAFWSSADELPLRLLCLILEQWVVIYGSLVAVFPYRDPQATFEQNISSGLVAVVIVFLVLSLLVMPNGEQDCVLCEYLYSGLVLC